MKYVSGIRPGNIHLGNYLGAIKQWKELQKDNDCIWFIADLHSDNSQEVKQTFETLYKCGITAKIESTYRAEILKISHELSFKIPVGWLNRMTQFKDKSQTESSSLALLAYPVLMAADIFHFGGLLGEIKIPVGNDQVQHIELIRDIARVNGYPAPEAVISKYPRIMSLTDGNKKMSKSDPNDYSRINIMDNVDVIRDKIMKAKSANNVYDDTAEMNNLWQIYDACGGEDKEPYLKVKDFKEELAELIIRELAA